MWKMASSRPASDLEATRLISPGVSEGTQVSSSSAQVNVLTVEAAAVFFRVLMAAELPTAQQISDAYEARMAAEAGGAAGSGVGAIGAGAGGDGEGGGGERAESRYSMNVAVRFRLVSDKNLIEIL